MAYDIQVQMLEIYNDNLRDLLSSDPTAKLDIMTAEASGENVPGVVCEEVHSPADVLRIMAHGAKNRCAPACLAYDDCCYAAVQGFAWYCSVLGIGLGLPGRTSGQVRCEAALAAWLLLFGADNTRCSVMQLACFECRC